MQITQRKNTLRIILFAVLSVFILILTGCNSDTASDQQPAAPTTRLEVVATRGAGVMPFELEETTHIFEKRDDGGLQQVIADNPADAEQIQLIRTHLAEEAERFRQGDFHDPAAIHDEGMAGLHQLVMGAERITITYSELPDGGQILYVTDDPELVAALHDWFDAQLADHGDHATEQH